MKKLLLGCLLATTLALSAPAARAAFIFTVAQVGNDVYVTGSGTVDITDLTLYSSGPGSPSIYPGAAGMRVGPLSGANTGDYDGGGLTGPASFGTGLISTPNAGTGYFVGIFGAGKSFDVPLGYNSGTALTDSATFTGASFTSLGLKPGTYTYTWGSGADADSLVVSIVPEPSTWALLGVGAVGAGFVAMRRRRLA